MEKTDRIIVSLTTWKKRDKVAVQALKHFQKQTLKPDKIILWLSETEYEGKIPEHLQECLDNHLVTEIRFVPGNTMCYKRWEVFKEYDDCYVILLDDDFYYPEDCIEELYKTAKEQQYPCCYFEKTLDYTGFIRKEIEFEQCSLKNQLYPGFCCIPPGLITRDCELFTDRMVKIRDIYNPVSDDLWFSLWFKSHNIPVYGIHKWVPKEILKYVITDSQSDGLWESTNRKKVSGVYTVVRNFATAVDALGLRDEMSKLYPEFDFDACSDYTDKKHSYENSVSIIMTAYKTRKYIKAAIDSVYNQTYFQTHNNWELLIGVDNCEETLNYLKTIMSNYDHHLRVFMMDSNKGTYITSNTLLKISKYNWIIRFDSDDVLKETAVERLFKECPGYDCCVYRFNTVNENMSNKKTAPVGKIYSNGCIFIKSSVIEKLGGYRPWPVSADAELLFCRISKFYKVKYLEEPLFYYRVNNNSLTRNAKTNGRSETRKYYNSIWKNTTYNTLSEAIIKGETNTYREVYGHEQLPAVNTFNIDFDTSLKTVVYTCVLDGIVPPDIEKQEGVDYICYSNVSIESKSWQIRLIPEELNSLSYNKQKEVIKICPHKYLSEYDMSIYVEPNRLGDLHDFDLNDRKSVCMRGNSKGCVYKLIKQMLKANKNNYVLRTLVFKYQQEGYPVNSGLVDTDIIIRKHNDDYCVRLMERWKGEVLRGSHLDQLSFNYCLWKIGDVGFQYMQDQIKSILR